MNRNLNDLGHVITADNLDSLPGAGPERSRRSEQIAGDTSTTHKFTSDERDSETGLDHTWFRQYSPLLGRWITPDPFAGYLDNPQSLNRYSYVLNNPLSFTDPFGLDCVYLSDDGKSIESIDSESDPGQCSATGGYWVDGTVDPNSVTIDYNSDCISYANQLSCTTPPAGSTDNQPADGNLGLQYDAMGNPMSLGESLRKPGESFSDCVQRVQLEAFGMAGANALNAVAGVAPVGTAATTSLATQYGEVSSSYVEPGRIFKGTERIQMGPVPKPSASQRFLTNRLGMSANTASATSLAGSIFSIAVTLEAWSLEGAVALACR
jgi:RHS repeat-associated protein